MASRKMSVSPASRMLSAISLGVFCREAPSTRAIMRSRNVSPGRAVMRTTIWSDSTRVPPVTAERSPPDSRITGADSPVMADSSTLAMPSMISPSPGIISPADTTHSSSSWSWGLGTSTISPLRRTWAIVSDRALRSESACALPRPSAMASAKLANSTVNHSHAATRPAKRFCELEEEPRSRSQTMVVRTLPTSTTIITGLRAMRRGSSLTTESLAACRMMAPSSNDRDCFEEWCSCAWGASCMVVFIRGSAAPRWARGRGRGSTSGRPR